MKLAVNLMVVAIALFTATLSAQVANEGLANGIIAARAKNAAALQQYNWNCRTEITQEGKVQDLRIDLVSCLPSGQLQKTLLNDQPGQLPGGFLRKAAAEKKQKETEKYVADLSKVVDQYTLPSAGKIVDFLAKAQVQPVTTVDGKTVLQVTGKDVVEPGDTYTMTVDGRTLQPIALQVATAYKGDAVSVSASFKATATGFNHLQYATVTVAAKDLAVSLHNYDYVLNQ